MLVLGLANGIELISDSAVLDLEFGLEADLLAATASTAFVLFEALDPLIELCNCVSFELVGILEACEVIALG